MTNREQKILDCEYLIEGAKASIRSAERYLETSMNVRGKLNIVRMIEQEKRFIADREMEIIYNEMM